MSFKDPIYPLENHCSVIHENTLYVYSPEGFQSLDLAKGSEWEKLPMDISLTGAECIVAPSSGDANTDMMFVVGGRVNETVRQWDYPGLMHFSFKEKKWDWQRSESWVTKERTNHAAIYIPDTKQILVYSGSSDPQSNGLSSESFLIDTKTPYAVLSQPAGANPPLVKPMLMQWDSTHAVMVGGGASNTAIYTFGAMSDASGAMEGWKDLGVAIPEPITSQETTQCTLISGDDGSKVLETFDMSVSPNKVTRTVLLTKGGSVAAQGTTVGGNSKRFTLDDFPKYNDTLAPKLIRSGFSTAQSDSDKIIFSGGNAEEPLSIFDASENSWINATELFTGSQLQNVLSPSSSVTSSSPTSTATETAAASSSAAADPAAGAPVNNKDRMLTVLGATLGAIFGIAALLILLLFCLRWRKSKKRRTAQGGYVEKDRMSFADRGAEFMKEAGGAGFDQPKFSEVNASQSSLAIIGGRAANSHKRGMLSDASTSGLVKKASPLGYTEPVELSKFDLKPEPIEERIIRQNSGRIPPQPKAVGNLNRSRSSGWSRYFANNDATNLAAMPADNRSTFASERTSTGSQSIYNDSRMYSQPMHAPPPLDIPKFENQRISKVTSGSPTLGNSTDNLPGQPMQAELARANSGASTRSGISHDDHYLRDPVESWTPVGHDERPPSSNYTGSVVYDHRDGASSYYPDAASSFYPKSGISSFYPGQPTLGAPDVRESTNTVFPAGNLANMQPGQQQHNDFDSFYPAPPRLGGAPDGRESQITVFPGGPGSNTRKEGGQDMSWLNLGVSK
ncbi:uncharacterized protein N0V89_006235 [Didymosphaeria variabile]|uniref:Galactose oxidase n=1 Tax=Didymosphaeria variabile TaxID=1932322 RepID=A0A9W8XPE4_9PLEO|nr:uncharacterized protein N0V89_006235 [Didymosphaeria variabile]KAJ4354498.1 hypothetical protein N0V89_006235 [Didymosphaeria variabile]